tara:strand:- start:270 stop:929 length:660 start_codon:yes stop_codon:yes gene_type:complete
MIHNLVIIFFFSTFFILTGCTTTRLEEQTNLPFEIREGESVVITSNSYHAGNETENDFLQCINNSLINKQKIFNVIPTQEFTNQIYPWFEPRTAPQTTEDLSNFLSKDLVRQKIKKLGIKYFLNISGQTKTNSSSGALSCAAGPGGGGCFGLAWWDDTSSYTASIWDLDQESSVGNVSTSVSGTSVIPALVIPIPIIARTQKTACDELSGQILDFFSRN